MELKEAIERGICALDYKNGSIAASIQNREKICYEDDVIVNRLKESLAKDVEATMVLQTKLAEL